MGKISPYFCLRERNRVNGKTVFSTHRRHSCNKGKGTSTRWPSRLQTQWRSAESPVSCPTSLSPPWQLWGTDRRRSPGRSSQSSSSPTRSFGVCSPAAPRVLRSFSRHRHRHFHLQHTELMKNSTTKKKNGSWRLGWRDVGWVSTRWRRASAGL